MGTAVGTSRIQAAESSAERTEFHLPLPSAPYLERYVQGLYDNSAYYHLLDQIRLDGLANVSTGSDCLLKQARILTEPNDVRERAIADSDKYPYYGTRVVDLIKELRAHGGSRYFESLDAAFVGAPEATEGCAWIFARETFSLTNLGTITGRFSWCLSRQLDDPCLIKLASEQRLVFQLPAETYSYHDDYFKQPKRTWRLTMILPASRFPAIRETNFAFWQWEDFKYFLMRTHGTVVLHVLGAFFRAEQVVNIVPYVVWT